MPSACSPQSTPATTTSIPPTCASSTDRANGSRTCTPASTSPRRTSPMTSGSRSGDGASAREARARRRGRGRSRSAGGGGELGDKGSHEREAEAPPEERVAEPRFVTVRGQGLDDAELRAAIDEAGYEVA